jgi:hypothetical protein
MTAATADAYLADLAGRVARLRTEAADAIVRAADAIEASARAGGLTYVFGTGHSHMLAEEVHYRAGGLAFAVPILTGPTMLHEGAIAGTAFERMPGLVRPILDRYPFGRGDVLVVVSNSGVNAVPVEAAGIGRERGRRSSPSRPRPIPARRRPAGPALPTSPTSFSTTGHRRGMRRRRFRTANSGSAPFPPPSPWR